MNRQTRWDGKWIDRGNVTFEEAAKLQAAECDAVRSDSEPLVVLVRCDSNPKDIRYLTVTRKPVEYVVHGMRGGM